MPLVEITEVAQAPPAEGLRASYLDRPVAGDGVDSTAFELSGWLLGAQARAREVQVVEGGLVLRTIPITVPRPDVVAAYPGGSEASGFTSLVGTIGLEPEFTLELRAVLEDGRRIDAGRIGGRRQRLNVPYQPRLHPLLVTSLGRTGTTLLMSLLTAHPAVVGYRTYPYETFPARYWMHVLKVLSEPADLAMSSHPSSFAQQLQLVGHNPFHSPPLTQHANLAELLGRRYVERLAGFCLQSIDELYARMAVIDDKPGARFFAEKFQPDHLPRIAFDLDPATKELVLVRDFRDVICSVFAFNAKRGTVEFGRERVESDEDYVRYIGLYARRLAAAWKARQSRSLLVRYEDLATRSHETMTAVYDYLGLEPHTASAKAPELPSHKTSRSVAESIERWRRELPRQVRAVVQQELGGALSDFGYELG